MIRVTPRSAAWLRQGFPWVYPDEVAARRGRPRPGTVVAIEAPDGRCLGTGVLDGGWIAVRRFRTGRGPLDASFLAARLRTALALREAILGPHTTAWRLCAAENDGLPGIRVDRYGDWLLVTLDSPSLLPLLDPLRAALEEVLPHRGAVLAWRPDPRDRFDPPRPPGPLWGQPPPPRLVVHERGMAMQVELDGMRNPGLFLDMREVRAWLAPHWGGTRVLNLFAWTGAFSVAAALGGAREVLTVDLSPAAIERARANFQANGLDPEGWSFEATDAREALDRLRRAGRRFDRIVLDPPAFARGGKGPLSAQRAYPRLVAACLRVLAPGGWLVGALHQGEVGPKAFHEMVRKGSRRAGVPLQLLHAAGQAPDHPAHVDFPEGRYLKVGVWRALPEDPT